MAYLISDIAATEIVAKLPNRLKVLKASPVVNDEQTLLFCDVKWLELFMELKDGAKVLDVAGNSVTVSTTTAYEVGDIVEIPIPKFFHGTPYNTVKEWHDFSTIEREKLPFIWLVTPVNERYNDFRQTVERVANCKFLFVHYSNWLELNQSRVNDTIRPLHKLIDSFIQIVNYAPLIFDKLQNDGTRKEYPKFGRETSKGIEEVIMNSTLGAVSLDIELRIKRNIRCVCPSLLPRLSIFDETFDNTFE